MNKEYIGKRLKNIRSGMGKKGLDAVFVTKRENYMYLSGFTGTSACLVITGDDAVLVTDFRYAEQASKQAPAYEVVQYKGSLAAAVNDVLKSRGVGRLGFEDAYLTVDRYEEFVKKLTVGEFWPIGGMIEELRRIKDHEEIKKIGKAVKIADDTFSHILKYIGPGVAEVELAAEMEYFMRRQGAASASFETIVASGKRSSMPHGVASEKKLEQGDCITLDFGALYDGYCSDVTRTVFLGQPDKKMKRIYDIVLEAQLKSIEGAVKGRPGSGIDSIARDIITKAGYGDNFGHGLGHSVGLEIHEEPRLSVTGNIIMKNGMVVTVEPGIYVGGLGGVRIEDIIVIRDDSPLVLTGAPKEMTVI